jgi:hypothetical protein
MNDDDDINMALNYVTWILYAVATVALLFTASWAFAGGDAELCAESPYGGSVTLTVLPCPATENEQFHYAYYTQTDGVNGDGCYIGDKEVVMVVWKDHPKAYYPTSEFGTCKQKSIYNQDDLI